MIGRYVMGRGLFEEKDGIDEEACLKMYDNNYDFYRIVLETFCKEIGNTYVNMKEKFATRDIESYRISVHSLKGSGASCGAVCLVRLATESNALIKEGKWEEAEKFHQPILDELERLMTLIPQRLEEKTK